MATKTKANQYKDYKRDVILEAMDDGVSVVVIARHSGWTQLSVREIIDKERTERLAATVTLGKRYQILESLWHHLGDSAEVAISVSMPMDAVDAIREKYWRYKEPKISADKPAKPSKRAMKPETLAMLKEMKATANAVIAKQLAISVEDADEVRACLWSRRRKPD